MTTLPRSARRTSYPALMLFGVIYLVTLAVVLSPESFRADRAMEATGQNGKETP